MAAEVPGTACTNTGCYDGPAKLVDTQITLWGHGNACWPLRVETGRTGGQKGPEILCAAVSSWPSLLHCRALNILLHLLLQALAAEREWLETRCLVTTWSCTCIKLSLVKARLVCKIKQSGPLRCDKRSGAVLRAPKGKDLPVLNLPTSIMASTCGDSIQEKQCCQAFPARRNHSFLFFYREFHRKSS